ncbi:synaptotagmin-like protein 2 isoform X1 [Carassius auratus]|uniref:Synaptotagmin-like protein 1 n=1 Tax=Carassius auratus TaxID=7957 RepID=A0A6P6NWP7_CARAU|nr:synaptotagmin-like protein 2 isoform X1 [Carassius auratus]
MMKQSKSTLEVIDLSFLSAEEEAAIRQVLLRDEDLKRLESGRVRRLRQSVPDLTQLKTLSGEWFEELKVKRYGQQTDVTAVVRSSMRWKKTAAHKPNPFLNDTLDENKERGKEDHNTLSKPSTDPRLIHPALSKETYHQYNDEHFSETSSVPRIAGRKEKLQAELDGNRVLNGTDPQRNSSGAQPKELSGDQTTTVFPFFSAAQDTKPERGTTKHATNLELRRKVSLPPALRKDQSFEENWVKISLEPNTVKPVHDESNTVGPNQKEVKLHVENTEALKKQDTSSPNIEPPSLNFMDQTSFQIATQAEPNDFFLERCSSTEFQNQPQTSSVCTSDGPELTKHSDHKASGKVNKYANAFQDSTCRDQQCSAECTFREAESDKLGPSDSANEHDKRKMVSRDLVNDEASSDRKGGEGKNVSAGLLAETDTDQVVECVAGEEQINKHSSAEKASQSQSLKWGIEIDSHEFPSDTLQGKDASRHSGNDRPVEMEKKTSNKNELLQNKTADISVIDDSKMSSPPSKPSVSDKTVQRFLDAHEEKEKRKIKSSNDQNLPKDTNNEGQVLAELSQDYLSMTDDGKLVHIGNAGVQVNTKHIDRTVVEPTQPAKPTSEDDAGLGEGSLKVKDEEDDAETEQKTESGILLSALARAQKSRPPVLQNIIVQEPKQETRDDTVPTIVIMTSESPDPTEMKGQKHGVSDLEALLKGSTSKTPSNIADAWEDEGVDSDDDDTSLSSYGSDLSSRKGYSASALSLSDRTGSLLSVYSDAGDFGNVEVQGSVEFAVMYSPVGELIIMIEQCQELAIANPRKQRTDPYVKTYLFPDKSRRSKRKTSIKKRTVNPVYVESLRYKVKREELPDKTLNLSVWHNDTRGRNVFLGQVEISFKTWDWGHEALTWYNLQPKTSENQESQESNGLLSVSLKYVPPVSGGSKSNTGEIHVWLREAKELRRLKPQGVDSFVKCYILPDTRKKSRQKTRIVKKTQDPVYNHAMVYDGFKTGEVSEACCELTVWDHNTLANQFLGGLRLSLGTGQSYGKKVDWMDSMDEEIQIWKRMLANPNSWVEGELPLRSSMTPRK